MASAQRPSIRQRFPRGGSGDIYTMTDQNMFTLMGMIYAGCGLLLILFRLRLAASSRKRIEAINMPETLKTVLIKVNSPGVLLLIGTIILLWGIVVSVFIPMGIE